MPHKPSNHDMMRPPLGSPEKCFTCLWDEAAEPCPRCLETSYATLREAAAAIDYRKRKEGWTTIGPEETVMRLRDHEYRERQLVQSELDKLLPLEENLSKQKRLEWETRTYASMHLLANPKWQLPAASQMPEPMRMVAADRITGEQYNVIRFTDNGCIATLDGGDEYFLPAGSFETLLV